MTKEEKKVLNTIVDAHNQFLELESTHSNDNVDWCNAIHTLQDILNRRIVRRDYPDIYTTLKATNHVPTTIGFKK